jgi:hypothetical protein
MDFKEWFEQNKSNSNWFRNLKKADPTMFKVINEWVDGSPSEKALLYLANAKSRPKCHCGAPVKFYAGKGFAKRCSVSCSAKATAEIRSANIKNKNAAAKQQTAERARITNTEKYGSDYAIARAKRRSMETLAKTEASRKLSMQEKYGISNPGELVEVQQKRKETYQQRTDEQRIKTREKNRRTRILNGTSLPDDHPSIMGTFKQYTRRVRHLTNRAVASNESLYKQRSRDLRIDHKYSIFDGFKNQVSPQIIANENNLQLMCRSENSKKNLRSSILLGDLLSLIGNHLK